MRGKKAYPEFVSAFITQCVGRGAVTPEEIVKQAKAELQRIDDQIKAVELLKTNRSKLLDVIATFDQPENKIDEAHLLPFFKLEYPQDCYRLCKSMIERGPNLYNIMGVKDTTVLFCIKQLLEAKIFARGEGHIILRGERFDEYMNFVWEKKP
jgi:hypothetical protein